MKLIRQLLYKTLGYPGYLQTVSRMYLLLYRTGRFRKRYPENYFITRLVKAGDVCIDIGANLGYYSVPLSKLVGGKGHVYAVEPVPMFNKILANNLTLLGDETYTVLPYALGADDGKMIEMGTPTVDGVYRHGRTQVIEQDRPVGDYAQFHEVEMRSPDSLFGELERLDFIKCDVEGYEKHLIPLMVGLLDRYKPSLQIEIQLDSRKPLTELLESHGYRTFRLASDKLVPWSPDHPGSIRVDDFYYVHEEQFDRYAPLIDRQTQNVT